MASRVPSSATNGYGKPTVLSFQTAAGSGCGLAFTACETRTGCDGAVQRADVGWSPAPTAWSSDTRGATTRNASTSASNLDISSSFCLKTS
jgi:hypothetical protein